jgi:predicted NUDIX family NTP pyrophosphohydrolase
MIAGQTESTEMTKQSAGILLFKETADGLMVFLVHPGGPYWARKDEGAWSIPKGEYEPGDDPLDAAKREFFEETGVQIEGECRPLPPVRQKSGKVVACWTCQGEVDTTNITSNTFEMEWPPRSGQRRTFSEVDRGEWFTLAQAKSKINPAQAAFLEELE